jgi:hypothetical protein
MPSNDQQLQTLYLQLRSVRHDRAALLVGKVKLRSLADVSCNSVSHKAALSLYCAQAVPGSAARMLSKCVAQHQYTVTCVALLCTVASSNLHSCM